MYTYVAINSNSTLHSLTQSHLILEQGLSLRHTVTVILRMQGLNLSWLLSWTVRTTVW